MSTLVEIAQQLKDSDEKVQLLYAFNGTGKTRLSREFKNLVQPEESNSDSEIGLSRDKILYYNAFTEDLFYWDNDLEEDTSRKLLIQPNSFIDWVISEQGQDQNIISHFQHYTDEKLAPKFEFTPIKDSNGNIIDYEKHVEAISFSYQRGNDNISENIKISKGEESNFIWSIFYSLVEVVVDELNIEQEERSTNDFNNLEYIFIDDPVSSLDENHLIELASNLGEEIFSSKSNLKFIITTHNPIFFNVLANEIKKNTKKEYTEVKGENKVTKESEIIIPEKKVKVNNYKKWQIANLI